MRRWWNMQCSDRRPRASTAGATWRRPTKTSLSTRSSSTDDAKRGALPICPQAAEHTRAQADIDRARHDDLQGLAAALGIEDVEIEIVFAKYAGLLAELWYCAFPAAADGRRDLERFGCEPMRDRARNDDRQQCRQARFAHARLRRPVIGLPTANWRPAVNARRAGSRHPPSSRPPADPLAPSRSELRPHRRRSRCVVPAR